MFSWDLYALFWLFSIGGGGGGGGRSGLPEAVCPLKLSENNRKINRTKEMQASISWGERVSICLILRCFFLFFPSCIRMGQLRSENV